MEIHGSYKVPYHPIEGDPDKVFEVDWTPPFRRVYMIPELEKKLSVTFPPPTEFCKPGKHGCLRLPHVVFRHHHYTVILVLFQSLSSSWMICW